MCAACHHRLLARALRPLEWYNLAKRHGWHQFLLHDDFYDDEGKADQPTEDVEQPEQFPVPRLASVSCDSELLLDYSITRWHLKDDVAFAWKSFPPSEVMCVLTKRYASSGHAISRILEIAGAVLGPAGAEFIRYVWGDYPDKVILSFLLRHRLRAYLPPKDLAGSLTPWRDWKIVKKRYAISSLGHFHSPKAVDWIEASISTPSPNHGVIWRRRRNSTGLVSRDGLIRGGL